MVVGVCLGVLCACGYVFVWLWVCACVVMWALLLGVGMCMGVGRCVRVGLVWASGCEYRSRLFQK
jgi:hypothetical protein